MTQIGFGSENLPTEKRTGYIPVNVCNEDVEFVNSTLYENGNTVGIELNFSILMVIG